MSIFSISPNAIFFSRKHPFFTKLVRLIKLNCSNLEITHPFAMIACKKINNKIKTSGIKVNLFVEKSNTKETKNIIIR